MDFLAQDDLLMGMQIMDQKLWDLDLSSVEARVLAFSQAPSDLRLVSGKTIGSLLYGSFFIESFFATARKRLLESLPLRESLQNLSKVRDPSLVKPEPYYRKFSKTREVPDGNEAGRLQDVLLRGVGLLLGKAGRAEIHRKPLAAFVADGVYAGRQGPHGCPHRFPPPTELI